MHLLAIGQKRIFNVEEISLKNGFSKIFRVHETKFDEFQWKMIKIFQSPYQYASRKESSTYFFPAYLRH